ncbi:ZNF225 [Branchiostoma lanceolatum]|uniref:ZNF225 protein n=1 Tax=Branchiostoma lanceolatum TaxID=7740 RepID=A0A8J9YTZ4_BRALA|nr:ZNF225 [Branchiostoma lanceolatum]
MATVGHWSPTGVGLCFDDGSHTAVSQVNGDSKTSDTEDKRAAQNLNNPGEKPFMCEECGYGTKREEPVPVYVETKSITGSRLVMATGRHGSPTRVDQNCYDGSPTVVSQVDCDSQTSNAEDQTTAPPVNVSNTAEKLNMCEEFGYRMANRANLPQHMREHPGKKPYKCDQCDYSASCKSNLNKHLLVHTGLT